MRPDQIDTIVTLSAPTLSPDGATAVVAASRPSFEADSYVGQLWRFETSGQTAPRRITRGTADTAPQYSPDGATLAFLRKVEGKPQLAIVEADGGEPRVLTAAPLGVAGFVWAPDSCRIALVAAMPEDGRYGTMPGVSAAQESPRRITGNKWRSNGRGYVTDKPMGIYVLEVPGDEAPWVEPVGRAASPTSSSCSEPFPTSSSCAQDDERGCRSQEPAGGVLGGEKGLPEACLVTPADTDAANPQFSADGEHVYFVAALHEGAGEDTLSSIYRVPAAGGAEPELVAPTGGTDSVLAQLISGSTHFAFGQDRGESGLDFVAKLVGVYVVDDGGETRRLTDHEVEEYGSHDAIAVAGDNDSLLAARRDQGGDTLVRFAADGSATELLPHGPRVILGAAEKSGTVVVTYSDPATAGELAVIRDGALTTLSDFATALPEPVEQIEFTAVGEDGYPVHGWVYLPAGEGPHPVLLNIHGGPFADYSWGYFDEPQAYAAAGYAVVQCNPRGSQGYGRAHGHAIKERMGTVDMQDVLTFLDGALAEFEVLDADRVGILGGSYGGYLTAWTIAHEHRFAAAIVERGYLDPLSFIGTSDIGWFFSEEYVGRDPEHALTQSPQAVAGQVRTPTLVMHSEEDWRCPPDQAQRYFASLRRAGVETEMLLFPGENHELSRSGTPWHRRQRFEAILDWFGRYLPGD